MYSIKCHKCTYFYLAPAAKLETVWCGGRNSDALIIQDYFQIPAMPYASDGGLGKIPNH